MLKLWAVCTGLWLLYLTFRINRFSRGLEQLARIQPLANSTLWPTVSLVVPACNEAETIGPAARSLLSLDYPNFELVIVNDRSTDGTGAILLQLAESDARVKIVEVSELPAGWLGKVHALQKGMEASTGEWVLFTDADVHHGKESLKKAITVCIQRGLDFLAVAPDVIAKSLPLRILIAQFLHSASLSINLHKIDDPSRMDCVGTGAFNLVRRSAYDRSRGFTWLRMETMDDMGLALALKRTAAHLGVMGGQGELEIEWYPSLRALVRGLEKNGFSVFQFSLPALIAYIVGTWVMFFGFAAAPLLTRDPITIGFVYGALVLYLSFSGLNLSETTRFSPLIAICFPVSFLIFPLVLLRAAIICIKQKGIYWRGTFYGLKELKAHQRMRPLDFLRGRGGDASGEALGI